MNRRQERLGSFIRQEVGQMLLRSLADPRLEGTLPSVTRVKVSPDLATADVYITLMGSTGKQAAAMTAIKGAAAKMRSELGKSLQTRVLPQLKFHQDEQLARELAVLDLIRKSEEERAEREGQSEEQRDGDDVPAETTEAATDD